MCAYVKLPCSEEPRWPLVPKITACVGSLRSGRRSKYSRSSRAVSISISFGAGCPAKGEMLGPGRGTPALVMNFMLLGEPGAGTSVRVVAPGESLLPVMKDAL